MSRLPAATFTSRQAQGRGRTAARLIGSRKYSPAKAFATRSTTGAHRAAMTGHTGSTRCGNTYRGYSESPAELVRIQYGAYDSSDDPALRSLVRLDWHVFHQFVRQFGD